MQASAAATGCLLLPTWTHAAGEKMARHLAARVVSAPDVPLPEGKREPFGWKTGAVVAVPMVLAWPDFPAEGKPTALRISVGLDVRDEKLIEAYLPKSSRVLGTFDVRYGCLFQVFEIPLAVFYDGHVESLAREQVVGNRTLWAADYE